MNENAALRAAENEAAESIRLSAWELTLRPIPMNEMLPCGQRKTR